MKGILADCRHAVRLYVRTPGTSLIAVFVLAIGMAFVGAFLSLYTDLVLRPEPAFEQSNRLATAGQNGAPMFLGLPIAVVDRMTEEMSSIEGVALAYRTNVLIGPEREQSVTTLVTADFFDVLKPRMALGRGIRPEENRPDGEAVAVISHRLWLERFQGSPDVLDAELELTRDPRLFYGLPAGGPNPVAVRSTPEQETTLFRIVGVMPETLPSALALPSGSGAETDTWIGLERAVTLYFGPPERRQTLTAPTFVRKRPGVSAAAVADELVARYSDYEFLASNYYPGVWLDVIDGIVDDITVKRNAARQLEMFLAGSILLSLVAAGNVSLFLLARAPGRRRELAIRMSVGAPFRRIARQLATEAGLLVVASAALGLFFSTWLVAHFRSWTVLRDANWRDVSLLDWRVLGLIAAFVLILTLLVSLTPLFGIRRLGIGATSRLATARASPMQRLTGGAQIAMAGALSGAAIAFSWYLAALLLGNPGYELSDRYVVEFNRADNPTGSSGLEAYFLEIAQRREAIAAIPGVAAVGFGNPVPGIEPLVGVVRIDLPDDPTRSVGASTGALDADFIDVLGLQLIHGRAPARGDSFEQTGPAMLVNQALARAVWGREDVVGERLSNRLAGSWSNAEVIGVLSDLSFGHPSAAAVPYVFLGSNPTMGRTAVVQTSMPASDLRAALEGLVSSGALEAEIGEIRPLRAVRNTLFAADRARAWLAITAAALVVLLTAFGFYGTLRYLVAAGRREYAIRASLGAGPRSLGRLVVARSALMSVPGLVLGAFLAFIAVAWLRADYLGGAVSPALVMLAVVVALGLLLLAASLGPARAARCTRPAELLRED